MTVVALIGLGCAREDENPPGASEVDPGRVTPTRTQEAVSVGGRPLYRIEFGEVREAQLETNLEEALTLYTAHPDSVDAAIWYGRRLAYLWRYRDAVDAFTAAIEKFPDDARLYRHRGHRYITLRNFDAAIDDLEHAAQLIRDTDDQVEPDGAPNAAGIPTSTLHTNIWYHLGLAYYLTGRFDDASTAFRNCLDLSRNNDMMVASVDWLYMSLRRQQRDDEAEAIIEPVGADLELLENHSYHRRILMYRGIVTPESLLSVADEDDRNLTLATQGYGVGIWYLVNGDTTRAVATFSDVLETGYWPAFGYIASEIDLSELSTP